MDAEFTLTEFFRFVLVLDLAIFTIIGCICIWFGWVLNWRYVRRKIRVVSDIYTPKAGRTPRQAYQDKIMQLLNEIADKRPLIEKDLGDGKTKIAMHIYKP